ncbi:hypothetical protein GE09DRAFT_32054 [Coniochaeta sp. 2T2.1]|nr:hypothetical protein GE09DRAFT_32054 [Coniochaeta sp. 2T2.1]
MHGTRPQTSVFFLLWLYLPCTTGIFVAKVFDWAPGPDGGVQLRLCPRQTGRDDILVYCGSPYFVYPSSWWAGVKSHSHATDIVHSPDTDMLLSRTARSPTLDLMAIPPLAAPNLHCGQTATPPSVHQVITS